MNVSRSPLALILRPVFRPETLPPMRCVLSNQFRVSESSVCMMLLLNSNLQGETTEASNVRRRARRQRRTRNTPEPPCRAAPRA